MVWLHHIRQVDGLTAVHSASRWSDCSTLGRSIVWLLHIGQVDSLTAPHSASRWSDCYTFGKSKVWLLHIRQDVNQSNYDIFFKMSSNSSISASVKHGGSDRFRKFKWHHFKPRIVVWDQVEQSLLSFSTESWNQRFLFLSSCSFRCQE